VGRPDGPLGRPVRCGLWAAFQLDANYRHKIVKSRNFETLTILYMYIPLRTTKIFPKNIGYAREYPGTTVGPPMAENTSKATDKSSSATSTTPDDHVP